MIRRERSSVQPPRPFLSRADEAVDRLRAFYRLSTRERSQRRAHHDPELLADRSLVSALAKLFERKCAYCESPLGGASPADTDRFRPAQEAMDLDGRVRDPDHYWWLAYEWDNLYPACTRKPLGFRFAAPAPEPRHADRPSRRSADCCSIPASTSRNRSCASNATARSRAPPNEAPSPPRSWRSTGRISSRPGERSRNVF